METLKKKLHKARKLMVIVGNMRPVFGLMLLSIVVLLTLSGTTMAWYLAESNLITDAKMVSGTVSAEIVSLQVDGVGMHEDLEISWEPGETKRISWHFENKGSKAVIMRARLLTTQPGGEETAWAEGTRFAEKGSWGTYFTTTTSASEKKVTLLAGQYHPAGEVTVRTVGGMLQVHYRLTDGWHMGASHLAVAANLCEIPVTANGNPIPGLFPYHHVPEKPISSHTYEIPLSTLNGGSTLYMAAHADLYVAESLEGGIGWALADDCSQDWVASQETLEGQPVTWWYHCMPVAAEEEIELCLDGFLPHDASMGIYTITLMSEVIQSSNEAYEIWPEAPCNQ